MRGVALALDEAHADALDQLVDDGVEVDGGSVLCLEVEPAVVPGEHAFCLGIVRAGVVDLDLAQRRAVGHQVLRQLRDARALARADGHHGDLADLAQEVQVALQLGLRELVDLVEDHEVGFLHLRLEQVLELGREVDVCLLRHDHAQALRVDDDGERAQPEFVAVVAQHLLVDVFDRAHAAAGDVAHHELGAGAVAHAADAVDRVLHLVADAARGDLFHRAAALAGEVGVDQLRAQVVGDDADLLHVRVHVLGQGDHRGGLASAQKAAHHQELDLFHRKSFLLRGYVTQGPAALRDAPRCPPCSSAPL